MLAGSDRTFDRFGGSRKLPNVTGMTTTNWTNRLPVPATDIGLGAVLAVALAGPAIAIADSWGGSHWVLGIAGGTMTGLLALFRRRHRVWAAVAGLALAVAATVAAWLAELPAEPGPAMTLALAVLVGSAVRHLPPSPAGGIAAAGLVVVFGAWLAGGFTAVAVLNSVGWFGAVAIGWYLRVLDAAGIRPRHTAGGW